MRYPSQPDGLTEMQGRVRCAFWEAVRDGRPCGAIAIGRSLGVTSGAITTAYIALERKGLKPQRNSRSSAVPAEWDNLVPDEFLDEQPDLTPAAAQAVFERVEPQDVGHPSVVDPQDRIAQLEAEIANLKRANEWLAHSDATEYLGGKMTVNLSDLHLFDKGHLISTYQCLQDKVSTLIERFQPQKFQVLNNGDTIPGRGIYRNQMLESVLPDATQQVAAGAWRYTEMHRAWVERLQEGVKVEHIVIKGNHDSSEGEDTCMRFVMSVRLFGVPARYVGTEWVANLADAGTYNVLVEHGYGNSSYNPTSNKQIFETLRKIVGYQHRGYVNERTIRRVLHGHLHWRSCGIERAEGLCFDTTGGLHRNDRANLGRNTRPVGWIVYVSPPGADDILTPIEVVPDDSVLRQETDDPQLPERNRQEAARCMTAAYEALKDLGVVAEAAG